MKKITLLLFIHSFLFYLTQSKPPESYSLIRGVNENINLNSGNLDLNIPLVNLSMGDLKLNNSLNYESRGFVPHIPSSYVGLNWNMLQLGKITRESHKIDLTSGYNGLLAFGSTGEGNISDPSNYFRKDCINTIFPSIGGQISYKKNIYENPYGKDYYASYYKADLPGPFIGGYTGKSHTFEPDKFYFDFMGYKGYFVVDNEGKPIVYCENASLKIDISNYGCHDIFEDITFSELKITDDKGNQFFFGGNTGALDINYSYARSYIEDFGATGNGDSFYSKEIKSNYIDGWLLKKIILNNGDVIEAYYQNPDITLLNNYRGGFYVKNTIYGSWGNPQFVDDLSFPDRQLLIANNLTVTKVRTFQDLLTQGYCTPACDLNKYLQTDTYTKKAVIDSIKINNTTLSYKYSLSENLLELTNKYLNEINLKNDNKIIKRINLFYENLGTTNKRIFLKEITNSATENISLEYYNTDDFPPIINSDYATNSLGYWNGSMNAIFLSDSNQDFNAFDTGLLKKVNYPTKGNTTYFYEHGDYSKIYKYGEQNNNPYSVPPRLYNENKMVNAPRIYKKIESSLNNNEETLYFYKNDNGSSSGIIDAAVYDQFGTYSNKNLSANLNSINSLHYSSVKVSKQGKGYTKYLFSDRVSNPDVSTSKAFHIPNTNTCTAASAQWTEDDRIYLSKQYERGKILKEEIYNNDNLKLKETAFEYNNFLNKLPNLDIPYDCSNCKVSDLNYYIRTISYGGTIIPCNIQTLYVPVLPYLQSSQTTKEYFGNNVIETKKKIVYRDNANNWYPHPIEESFTTPTGTSIKKYLYPSDFNNPACWGGRTCSNNNDIVGGQWNSYSGMVASNLILPILEISKSEDNKFSLKENFYISGNRFYYALKKIRHSLLNTSIDFTNYSIASANTVDDIKFDVHDDKANPLQTTMEDGIPITIIYGYGQTLPIATINGISYEQLMQIFGQQVTPTGYLGLDIVSKSNMDKDQASEQLLLNALESFRNNPALANYQITTYTYDPLIGVKSITPPSGIRERYIYDSAGRLEKVIDMDGKILKEMKYNYKN